MQTEIVSSRRKTALGLLVALGFTAIAIFSPDRDDTMLFWGGVFFGLCAVVFVLLLLWPQRLLLDDEGFTISGGMVRAPAKTAWRDIDRFFIVPLSRGSSMIGFNYKSDAPNKPRGAALAQRVAGADGAIGGVWPGSKAALVDRLNAYRERSSTVRDV